MKKEMEKLKLENKELNDTVTEHQRFLDTLDGKRRCPILIIPGVAESVSLENVTGATNNDTDKVAKVLQETECHDVGFVYIERLGSESVQKMPGDQLKFHLEVLEEEGMY